MWFGGGTGRGRGFLELANAGCRLLHRTNVWGHHDSHLGPLARQSAHRGHDAPAGPVGGVQTERGR